MFIIQLMPLAVVALLYPAPKDPEPDDKGRGFFGVQLVDNGGVLITRVEPGSPADKAGIRVDDVIHAIDDTQVPSVEEAREIIAKLRPGTVAQVGLRRAAAMVSVKVKVGVRPETLP